MALASDLIARTRRHLLTGSREEQNLLSGNYTSGANQLAMSYPAPGLRAGASLAIDLELFYVLSVDTAGAATVIGAQQGSLPSNHNDQSLVTINPKFSDFDVFNALNNEMVDLSTWGLYQVITLDITYRPPVSAYDLTGSTDFFDVLDIHWKPIGPSKSWPRLTDFSVDRGQDTTIFPSGNVIRLFKVPYPGRQIRVRYSAPFTQFVHTSDTTASTGLADSMIDIPPLGAAIELAAGLEVKRNFTDVQGSTRHMTEVPPAANTNSTTALMRRRLSRIGDERQRLSSNNPLISASV